jgi:hypothetical protein
MTDVTNSTTYHTSRWLIVLTAFLGLTQAGSAVRALQTPADLAMFVSIPMALGVMAGVLWSVLAGLVTLSLIRHQPTARLRAAWLWAGYLVYAALRWLVFVRADYDAYRLPLLLVIMLLLLFIPVAYILRSAKKPALLVDEITRTEKAINNDRKS